VRQSKQPIFAVIKAEVVVADSDGILILLQKVVIPGLTRNLVPAKALNSLDSGSGPE